MTSVRARSPRPALAPVIVVVGVVSALLALAARVDEPHHAPVTTFRPAVGAYVGATGISSLRAFGAATGTTPTVAVDFVDGRSWATIAASDWLLDPWTAWLKADPSRRLVLSVPMLATGSRGRYDDTSVDTYFSELAFDIAHRDIAHQVTIRLGWEMNSAWFPWGGNPAGFKRMWRRVIPLFRAASPAFRFDWCPNGFEEAVGKWYPGDDVVDVIGVDLYDVTSGEPGGDRAARWSTIAPNLARQAAFAAVHAKPAVIDEWGLWTATDTANGGGGDDPTYVKNMLRWATDHRYEYHAYFNVPSGGVGTTLTQNPEGLAAYRAGAVR